MKEIKQIGFLQEVATLSGMKDKCHKDKYPNRYLDNYN